MESLAHEAEEEAKKAQKFIHQVEDIEKKIETTLLQSSRILSHKLLLFFNSSIRAKRPSLFSINVLMKLVCWESPVCLERELAAGWRKNLQSGGEVRGSRRIIIKNRS
ncbi:hypothetical protein LIER_36451 [Lithospermum erythrorhizon]|uniref:Uncharacterized protein n=1 Tax=Lithospermum erythrorhizon TaxID=34254 RepID=A0AAV3P668_LITER